MIIGVSLKMYFSHARTVAWVQELAGILADHPVSDAVTAFVIPQFPSIPASLDAGRHPQDVPGRMSVIYGGSAGPGLLTEIADSVDGLFLGRFAHESSAVRDILDEVGALSA